MANYFNAQTILYFNGEYRWATNAHASLYSQTLHYGFGVFEGIRCYATAGGPRIFKAKEHYDRLRRSCGLLGIPLEYSTDEMVEISYEILRRNGLSAAYLRPLVTCEPNMGLTNGTPSQLLIAAWEWGAYLGERLLRLKISPFCRPHPRSIFIEAKAAGHYVNSILATSDAKKDGFDEALLLDCDGFLAEGPGANFFFEKNGRLFTPERGHILPGITRETVFEIAAELGVEVVEGRFLPEELAGADAAFFCGTGAEIVGIESVDGRVFPRKWADSVGFRVKEAYLDLVFEKNRMVEMA